MSKPTDDPQNWADDASAVTADPGTLADIGFVADDPARYDWLNFVLNNFGKWIDFLRSGGGSFIFRPAMLNWYVDSSGSLSYDFASSTLALTISNDQAYGYGQFVNCPGTATDIDIDVTTVVGTVTVKVFLVSANGSTPAAFAERNFTSSDNGTTVTMSFTSAGPTFTDPDLKGPWYVLFDVACIGGQSFKFGRFEVNLS